MKNVNIIEIFESLPLTERTFLKRLKVGRYDFKVKNEYNPCQYDIYVDDKIIGMVKYYKGRKLSFYSCKG